MRIDKAPVFRKLLARRQSIVIVTHHNPDGDAMGSSLGMMHYLKKLGHKVTVIIPNACPDFLQWLPGTKGVIDFSAAGKKAETAVSKAQLIFTLDFNSLKRLEKLGELIGASPAPKVVVDHHPAPDNYAKYWFHDDKACSTAELVYRFVETMGHVQKIDKKVAACLYTGLLTDSGSFRYPCVTADTHRIVAGLLKTGISPSDIYSAVYDNYSIDRMRLFGYALREKMQLVDDTAAHIALSEKELAEFKFRKGDTEGLVNYPFMIKGVKVSALFTESPDFVRISLRSKGKIDVNAFARKHFNGGGHKNAAGGKSYDSLEETTSRFRSLVKTLF